MRRYVNISLAIGAAVTVVTLALYFVGVFAPLNSWLGSAFASRGIFFEGGEVVRVKWFEILVISASSFGIAWCVVDITRTARKIFVVLVIAFLVFGLSPTLAVYHFFFEPFSSLFGVVLSAVLAFVYAGTEQGKRKRLLQEVLGARVSLRTFDGLLERGEAPDFQGAGREVSVLTCRFLNQSDREAGVAPADLVKMSNLFSRTVSAFLLSKGTYLEQSGPEALRGTFGMLTPQEDHAQQASRTALELSARLRSLSHEFESRWFQPLRYGVGICSGQVTVGVCGDPSHFSFGSIGFENDFSMRLASANLRYGSHLLICPETYRLVKGDFEVRPMEMFYDPSTNLMCEIYQLLSSRESFSGEDRVRRDLFWKGMIFLREKNYEAALDHFSRSRLPGGEDAPVAYFIARAQEGVASPESPLTRLTRELTEEGHARLISAI